jgi:hypothetical protein
VHHLISDQAGNSSRWPLASPGGIALGVAQLLIIDLAVVGADQQGEPTRRRVGGSDVLLTRPTTSAHATSDPSAQASLRDLLDQHRRFVAGRHQPFDLARIAACSGQRAPSDGDRDRRRYRPRLRSAWGDL